ncbi:MAG: potassium transporter TrkA, partial [Acidobacteria bacterium]|nr:potassium transporter TrkA [Acidobacteriota bacterium]
GRDEAQLIETGETIARVVAQTCRQTGLSGVYTELLDYGGDEIYFKRDALLDGLSFADSLFTSETCSVIGVKTAEGVVQLNPPMDRRFAPGDEAIVIAADAASIRLGRHTPSIDATFLVEKPKAVPVPEKTLLLGWSSRAPIIIRELDNYVAPGSLITVVAEAPTIAEDIEALRPTLTKQQLDFRRGDSSDRATIESAGPEQYEHIIVLCYADDLPVQKADAKTLVTLLHLRDIEARSGANRYSIVSEMLDVRNRELAQVTQADDFIVSENLTSLLVAQVTENKDLRAVFDDVFDSDGSEIYMRAASDYVTLDRPMSFWHVVEAARRRGEIAIGYLLGISNGVRVNPPKGENVTFGAGDRIVVVAED